MITDDTPCDPPPRYELPEQHPAQNPPGERVTDHDHADLTVPWDIYGLLDTADHMRQHVRGYQFDPVYHRLCARLRTYRLALENMDDTLPTSPALRRLLTSVEDVVGKSPARGGKL